MRDMSRVYYELPTAQLLKLRSQKHSELQRLENRSASLWQRRDERVLRQQIIWINAVLEARDCQIGLFD